MEWKPIEEYKPEKGVRVLCAGRSGGYFVGYWRHDAEFCVPEYRCGYGRAVAWAQFDPYEKEDER